jgi:hypothetical protein
VVAGSQEEFAAAVRAHRFEPIDLGAEVLARGRRSLDSAGLLVVGEAHGVRETPAALLALAQALGTRAIAFEWSWEELDELVQDYVARGSLDLGRLWSLPAWAEVFGGDGRVTAGHFALLQRLRDEGRLDQVVLYDRLDPEPPVAAAVREREMADRLLAEWDGHLPLLLLTGAGHARLDPDTDTLASLLARSRPGLEAAMIEYGGGQGWFRGVYDVPTSMPPASATLRIARATPAVVLGRACA